MFRINMSHTTHDAMRKLHRGDPRGGEGITAGRSAFWPTCRVRSCGSAPSSDDAGDARRRARPSRSTTTRRRATRRACTCRIPKSSRALEPGHTLLLDDGKVRLERDRDVDDKRIVTRVEVGGKLSARKGVSLPDTTIAVLGAGREGPLRSRSRLDAGIDWVALSFIQRPEDIAEAKKITRGRARVMAKIEKPQAVQRLAEIMDFTDALMVARGDLGVEMPLEKVPGIQKQMTRTARRAGKPVVVATQMLESMINSPVPTRAEVSDVATAIFEGADAVMLSAESAAGQYPVEAVATMNRIAEEVETDPTLPLHHRCAAHRAGGDRRRRDRGRGAADRRDARSAGDRLLDRSRARPRCGSRASGRNRRSSRSRPTSRPAAGWRWSGACIASSPRMRAISTTWWTAPAGSPSGKASPRPASASSSWPACRSARPAPPTWCGSRSSASEAERRIQISRPSTFSVRLHEVGDLLQMRIDGERAAERLERELVLAELLHDDAEARRARRNGAARAPAPGGCRRAPCRNPCWRNGPWRAGSRPRRSRA